MLASVPPSLLELRWGDDILRFELEPDGAGCTLRLRVTFPVHGKAARDAAGWHVVSNGWPPSVRGTEPPWEPPVRLAGRPPHLCRAPRARGIGHRSARLTRGGAGPARRYVSSSPLKRQVQQPAQGEARPPVHLVARQLHCREPRQQGVEGDLAFHAGQRRPDAVMDAPPEAQRRVSNT